MTCHNLGSNQVHASHLKFITRRTPLEVTNTWTFIGLSRSTFQTVLRLRSEEWMVMSLERTTCEVEKHASERKTSQAHIKSQCTASRLKIKMIHMTTCKTRCILVCKMTWRITALQNQKLKFLNVDTDHQKHSFYTSSRSWSIRCIVGAWRQAWSEESHSDCWQRDRKWSSSQTHRRWHVCNARFCVWRTAALLCQL